MKTPYKLAKTTKIERGASVAIGENTYIMDYCVLGIKNPWNICKTKEQKIIRIGKRCVIYPWSILYEGSEIRDDVRIFERSLVGSRSVIGSKSRLVYGSQVHDNVIIGSCTTIGGFISDNCKIGNNCFIYGSLIHRHDNRDHGKWDEIDEIGPTIEDNVFVGWGAIIVGNIKIGKGAEIKPCAFVTKDVAAGKRYG